MSEFVHLHLHSEYSLLDGACRISDIPLAAAAAGQSAVAITDHGVMYGTLAFYKACKKAGIKPIIGCEVYVAPRSMSDKSHDLDSHSNHLVLLVKNEIGYRNLIYMVSRAFTDGFYVKPRIDMSLLENHSEGLVALSACLAGKIPRLLLSGNYEEAVEYAKNMERIFGKGNYYIEIQNHGIKEQLDVLPLLSKLSKDTGIPLVATNDIHYIKKEDAATQAILLCIQTNNVITDGRPVGFETDEFYFKSTEEMEALFSEYDGAIENTARIADMCNFDFTLGETHLPRYKPDNGEEPGEYLKTLALEGLDKKEAEGKLNFDRNAYISRLEYELSVIGKMGYSEYYLIVWDFVNYAKSKNIPVGPGRGSGAGSLTAYLIGITDIDPLKYNLLFERFLNPERVSMPDFDIDFCYNRRDEVIDYVKTRYGEDHVAQIIAFGTMAARAVVRDAGRALGMNYADVDKVAKLIPRDLDVTLDKALEGRELKELYESDGDVHRLIDIGRALEGMPRHPSTHAAGVVITADPVTDYVPVADNNGSPVTQFTMEGVAELGLLKFDFLALRYLTVIDAAERQIKESVPGFDISKVPDDPEVYSMISKGRTDGVFQLESPGMKQMLLQLRPDKFEEIIAAIALFRPGPMDSIPRYIEQRNGGKINGYDIPGVNEILEDTYGCIVYQEQVMQIFRVAAGYSFGRADVVRRAIAKKHSDELEREREAFFAGVEANGFRRDEAERLFGDITGFANYAFNKSHAAAYALLSYRTAYLKCKYPVEYFCALLTSVIGNPSKTSEYIAQFAKQGVKLLPPDINKSFSEYHAENGSVRFPISAVRNIGVSFSEQIVAERYDGEFTSYVDFLTRMGKRGLNKRQLEALIKCGALDSLGVYRSRMIATQDTALAVSSGNSSDEGQIGILDEISDGIPLPVISYPDIPELSAAEKLYLEKEFLGIFASGHVLDDYSEHTALISPAEIHDITESFNENGSDTLKHTYRADEAVAICVTVLKKSVKDTRRGDKMAFVTVSDKTGETEVIVFPELFAKIGYLINTEIPLCVSGTISNKDEDEIRILANDMFPLMNNEKTATAISIPLPELPREKNKTVPHSNPVNLPSPAKTEKVYLKLDVNDKVLYEKLLAYVEIFSGNVPVILYDTSSGKYLKGNCGISASPMAMKELRSLLGDDAVVTK